MPTNQILPPPDVCPRDGLPDEVQLLVNLRDAVEKWGAATRELLGRWEQAEYGVFQNYVIDATEEPPCDGDFTDHEAAVHQFVLQVQSRLGDTIARIRKAMEEPPSDQWPTEADAPAAGVPS